MTVLYDDRGLTVDRTKPFLEKYQNIGLLTSGGTDSSFLLWWLSKCITDLGFCDSHIILPIHGRDRTFPVNTTGPMIEIINLIRNYFPKVVILDPYVINYRNLNNLKKDIEDNFRTPKSFFINPHREKLEKGFVDITISGSTSAPIFEDIDLGEITKDRNYHKRKLEIKKGIFVDVDKKFLAAQYKKFNLMQDLFPLTKSCTVPYQNGIPCKECDWCKEKYWAFGCYDGGIK